LEDYFESLKKELDEAYEIAEKARSKGFDPENKPEIPLAEDLAARVEKLAGPEGVAETIRELEEDHSRENLAFKIAEMIVNDEFGHLPDDKAAEQSIRTCLAIITEGIAAAAPIEGITHVDIKKNFDGSSYLAIYFAGPIRSAGGTAAALAVLTGDFVRRKLDLNSYNPSDMEVERMVEEVNIYEETAGLQYTPSKDEVKKAYRNIPIEVTGEPTETETVTGHRDLERVETDRVRGGAVLAIVEGVLQKAPKIRKHLDNLGLQGWEWLGVSEKSESEEQEERNYPKGDKYLADIIAGRPVFSYPSKEGGFRLRYGRARNTGFAAAGIHPATMRILNDHVSAGTQLKTERPGKATAIGPVDTIEGPTVKLEDGSVLQIDSASHAEGIREEVEEILALGDILFGYGEFVENNHPLMPSGYCEEWWVQEVRESLEKSDMPEKNYIGYTEPPFDNPSPRLAVDISQKFEVPLHPRYTYNFHDLELEEIKELGIWLSSGTPNFFDGKLEKLVIDLDEDMKRLLETLLVPHKVENDKIILEEEVFPLATCLGLQNDGTLDPEDLCETIEDNPDKDSIKILEILTNFPLREKSPTRIGARVGRPEKTKPRKMSPPPHVLFPIGMAGGKTRNIKKAMELEKIKIEVAHCECPDCGDITILKKCPDCGARTELVRYCSNCDRTTDKEECLACGNDTTFYREREVELKSILNDSLTRINDSLPDTVKGVQGMMSTYKLPEPLEKGVLRSKHDLYVFKDGTIRFDATDLPLTHFKPKEVETDLETLKELGYKSDHKGDPLKSEDQTLELKVQDILLPPRAADYLLRTAQFVDELLEKFYGIPPYYEASEKEDLIGKLVIGLAPHTSAGITGRIIGFSEANVGYAHPYFHAAKRRNCFHSDTEIWIKNGDGGWELRKIENFVEENLNSPRRDDFGALVQDLDKEIFVPSVDKEGEILMKRVEAVSKHPAPRHLIEIETETGKQIKVTPDHRMVRWNSGVEKTYAQNISEEDNIPISTISDATKGTIESVRKRNTTSYSEADPFKPKPKLSHDGGNLELDEVKNVRIVETDLKKTYSLTVEDTHTLIANGIFTGQCDGDEDAVMLLMDGLLNFSEYYLPETRGGSMDAPLVLTPHINPSEIDDEVHNVDVDENYTVEFYESTLNYEDPDSLDKKVEIVEDRLGTEKEYSELNFSAPHNPTSISAGPKACRYKSLGPMEEKTDSQLELARKIRAVDERDVAERLIENHFIPDLKGNLRAFFRQKFRCPNCEEKFRRIPLTGRCTNCGGDLILTVTRGGVEKYMKVATRVSEDFDVMEYTKQRLGLIEEEIDSIFESDYKEQLSLADFA